MYKICHEDDSVVAVVVDLFCSIKCSQALDTIFTADVRQPSNFEQVNASPPTTSGGER